jgi:hypothetical protein
MKKFLKTSNQNNFYQSNVTLSSLANEYKTDKGTADAKQMDWSKEYPQHMCWHYTETYEKYMNPLKNQHVSMLEIGVCDKRFPYASIKMWMGYFKNIDFYAVDNFWGHKIGDKINDIKQLNNQGVNFIYADQGSFEDWDELITEFPNKFDIVVEDGSHWPNHMMVSLWKSINVMKSGGYYFMEDIQNPLKSKGWFKYDNSLLGQELLETLSTKILYSSFLNNQQNYDIQNNFELVDLILDPSKIHYLAVLRKK